jgi:hypothetical protein
VTTPAGAASVAPPSVMVPWMRSYTLVYRSNVENRRNSDLDPKTTFNEFAGLIIGIATLFFGGIVIASLLEGKLYLVY